MLKASVKLPLGPRASLGLHTIQDPSLFKGIQRDLMPRLQQLLHDDRRTGEAKLFHQLRDRLRRLAHRLVEEAQQALLPRLSALQGA